MLKFEGKKLTIDFEEAERLLRKGAHKAVELSKEAIDYTANKYEEVKESIEEKKSEKEVNDLFNQIFEDEPTIDERSNDEIAAAIQRDTRELAARGVTNLKDFVDETKIKAEIGLDNLLQFKDEKINDLFLQPNKEKTVFNNNNDNESFLDYLRRTFNEVDLPENKEYIHEVILSDEGIVLVIDNDVNPNIDFEITKLQHSIDSISKELLEEFDEFVNFALLFESASVFFLDEKTGNVAQPLSLFQDYNKLETPSMLSGRLWTGVSDPDDPKFRIALSLIDHEVPFDYKEIARSIKSTYPQLSESKIETILKECESIFESDGLFYYLIQLKDLLDLELGLTMFAN